MITTLLLLFSIFLLLGILTVIYWFLWGHKIKNKQAVLALLEPIYKIVYRTVTICISINPIITLIFCFVEKLEISETIAKLIIIQFLIPLIVLIIPDILIRYLKRSIKEEEKE